MDSGTQVTIVGLLLSGMGALGAVVRVLWARVNSYQEAAEARHKETLTKLEECEKDRNKLWADRDQMGQQLQRLEAAIRLQGK